MTVVRSLRTRKKEEARSRVIAAAIRLFSERTIEETTVDEIALAADVGKGTIYNHFRSKEEIVVAFLIGIELEVAARVVDYASAEGSLAQILISFLQFQLDLKSPHLQFVRVFFAQLFTLSSSSSAWVQELQNAIDPTLYSFFSTLQSRELIRPDLDLEVLIQLFKMLHVGLMTVWVMEGPPWTGTKQILKQQIQMFCEGIERRGR